MNKPDSPSVTTCRIAYRTWHPKSLFQTPHEGMKIISNRPQLPRISTNYSQFLAVKKTGNAYENVVAERCSLWKTIDHQFWSQVYGRISSIGGEGADNRVKPQLPRKCSRFRTFLVVKNFWKYIPIYDIQKVIFMLLMKVWKLSLWSFDYIQQEWTVSTYIKSRSATIEEETHFSISHTPLEIHIILWHPKGLLSVSLWRHENYHSYASINTKMCSFTTASSA